MNCKPGDWAVVVQSSKYPEHIGKLVQVHEYSEQAGGWTHTPKLPIPNVIGFSLWIQDVCLAPVKIG